MTKRAAEAPPSPLESSRVEPDFVGYYRGQVEELLSQEEMISQHELEGAKKSSTEAIGAELSNAKNEKLNALLRQCMCDVTPEVNEMQSRVSSVHQMSQLRNKKRSISPANAEPVIPGEEVEEDIQFLMMSDPVLFKEVVSKHKNELDSKLENMKQQLEKLLDKVATTCRRPMSRGEKRDLQKSIKELPKENLKRVAEIIKCHYAALGKEFPDEVVVNMEEEDNVMLWRLHYYIVAVKSARKLASESSTGI